MDGLKESSGFIRSRLAKTVNLRITPELVFEIDDSIEKGARIDSILKELNVKKEDQRIIYIDFLYKQKRKERGKV